MIKKKLGIRLSANAALLPYSEKFWRGFNLAQGENDIFAADLIWRRAIFF